MDVKELKKYIIENDKVEYILENLNCQKIKFHNSGYWTCGNPPPSDNPNAVTIYKDNLKVINYTKDMSEPSDIFTLIEYYKGINFFKSLKWICDLLEIDFYKDSNEELPKELLITKQLMSMKTGSKREDDDDTPIKPLSEEIIKYYPIIGNTMFFKDGIDYQTQYEFGLSYDNESNRILIPIHSEIGDLVSYKGRLFKDHIEEWEQKYLYLYPCPRNRILFGYHKTHLYIKKEGWVWVGEAEKFCLQLWSYGYYNSVATGGTKIGQTQVDKISRLGVPICFCFDKDIEKEKVEKIADRFTDGIDIYAIFDEDGLLRDKEAPSDRREVWELLVKNNVYKIK